MDILLKTSNYSFNLNKNAKGTYFYTWWSGYLSGGVLSKV